MPVPTSAYEANLACAERIVRLDSRTRLLRRSYDQSVSLQYYRSVSGWLEVVRYMPNGSVYILPNDFDWRLPGELRRIDAALPLDWAIQFRGRHQRPWLVYRGAYTMALANILFLPNGDIQWGTHEGADRITLADLNDEADDREGDPTARPRRRRRRAVIHVPPLPGRVDQSRIYDMLTTFGQSPTMTTTPVTGASFTPGDHAVSFIDPWAGDVIEDPETPQATLATPDPFVWPTFNLPVPEPPWTPGNPPDPWMPGDDPWPDLPDIPVREE